MIATRRGLVVLAALAVALLVALVLDVMRSEAPRDRALVPSFDEAAVTRLQWTAHPVGPYLTLERAGTTWRRTAPIAGAVEQAPVANVLAALRGARWHRSESGSVDPIAAHLQAGPYALSIGRADPATSFVWIGVGDRRYLVDAWVARALTPSPLELAIAAPLANIASAPGFSIAGLRIEGQPRALVGANGTVMLEVEIAAALERAIADLVIEDLPGGAFRPQPSPSPPDAIDIEIAGTRVVVGGDCETRVRMTATTGDGCIARGAATALQTALATARGAPEAIAARAPVPVGFESIVLADGATLDLSRLPTIVPSAGAPSAADPEAVTALLLALRSPVERGDVVTVPATPPIARLVVAIDGVKLTLELHPGRIVRRAGEPIGLRLGAEAFAVLQRGAGAFRDRTVWREDATTIEQFTVDGTRFERGQALGEWWRVTGAGRATVTPTEAASIDQFVGWLAQPSVIAVTSTTFAPTHRIEIVVRPPVGDASTHRVELAVGVAGCRAKLDGVIATVANEICQRVPRSANATVRP